MDNLLEIVFENINKNCLNNFLHKINESAFVTEKKCTENISLICNKKPRLYIEEGVLDISESFAVFFKIKEIKVGAHNLENVFLRVVKYENYFDVDFNFKIAEEKTPELMHCLHAYAKKISIDFEVKNFFGGIEPASDEETRYFTNEISGPLGKV